MPTILWLLVLLRVGALSAERLAFHGLGRQRSALAATAVAYGGAALLLWAVCIFMGTARWVGSAFWPGAIYSVSFLLYTSALALGPVGLVSGFANASVVMLFFLAPRWDAGSLAGVFLFMAGSILLLPRPMRLSRAVLWMLLSDAALVVGRLLDVQRLPPLSLPYAASLFTAVVVWLAVPVIGYGAVSSSWHLLRERWAWAGAAAVVNGLSYVTVLELLRHISPTLVEAVSACAGVVATVAGVVAFHEAEVRRKVSAAALMTLATLILLFSR